MQAARHLGRPDRLGPGTSKCHCRRHRRRRDGATSPGQAAHRPTRSAGRCHPPQAGDPGGWPTLMCQVLTTRARDQGSRPPPSSWPRPWARPPGTGAQLASYAGLAPVTRRCGSSIHGEVRLPRRQQEAQARHVPLRLRLPCAPTPSPGPTTSANATKANHLGPGRPRPGPPPHPDPARHDPRWSPLHPPTSHETTHRRLTHHIGAPYPLQAPLWTSLSHPHGHP